MKPGATGSAAAAFVQTTVQNKSYQRQSGRIRTLSAFGAARRDHNCL